MSDYIFCVTNNLSDPITNLSASYNASQTSASGSIALESLPGTSGPGSNTTNDTSFDVFDTGNNYFYVSFVDSSSNLWFGWVNIDYAAGYGLVTITINQTTADNPFTVGSANGGAAVTGNYLQNT